MTAATVDRIETGRPQRGQSVGHSGARDRVNSGDPVAPRIAHPPRLLSMKDAAASLGVSYWTLRALVEAGKLPAVRLPGRLIRIDVADLARFVEQYKA